MSKERIIGIDYLRAFFSVCVVLVHLGLIAPSAVFYKIHYAEHKLTWSDPINFCILMLAVPVFFLISNYLFLKKADDKSALLKHLQRIGKLAIFWMVLLKIFIFHGWEIFQGFPDSLKDIPYFILSGGETPYWFFITLMALTIITYFAKRLSIFYVSVFFLLTTLQVLMLPVLSAATGKYYLVAHCNPLNFLPYPFAAILIFHLAGQDRTKIKPLFIILTGFLAALLAVLEWTIYINEHFFSYGPSPLPLYTRPSLVFLAMTLVLTAIKTDWKSFFIVRFMSNKSLALYCLHIFFVYLVKWLSIDNLFISLLIVITLSYFTAMMIKPFIRNELIE